MAQGGPPITPRAPMVERLIAARGERIHSMVEGAILLGIAECVIACLYWGLR